VSAPAAAARSVKRELLALASPAGTFDARRYFRDSGNLGFHNIGMPRLRGLARRVVLDNPQWTVREAMTFADLLMRDRFLESKAVAVEVVGRYRRTFAPGLLARWKKWLAGGHSANWATTDGMCGLLIGPLLVAHPGLVPKLLPWARHRSLWVRRASIVGLIPLARRGHALDELYRTASVLHPDPHDLIHKAVGWALREAGKADPRRLERYLRRHGPSIPRTTVRYAIEGFPDVKRRALLKATR
jgi:3-methyladenine DNA glycosylase AlkD